MGEEEREAEQKEQRERRAGQRGERQETRERKGEKEESNRRGGSPPGRTALKRRSLLVIHQPIKEEMLRGEEESKSHLHQVTSSFLHLFTAVRGKEEVGGAMV